MTAAERLRGLLPDDVTTWNEGEKYAPITRVLPELIAVVGAAETVGPIFECAARLSGMNRTPVAMLYAAIAALDAKLSRDEAA